jgi:hypothetical protein
VTDGYFQGDGGTGAVEADQGDGGTGAVEAAHGEGGTGAVLAATEPECVIVKAWIPKALVRTNKTSTTTVIQLFITPPSKVNYKEESIGHTGIVKRKTCTQGSRKRSRLTQGYEKICRIVENQGNFRNREASTVPKYYILTSWKHIVRPRQ